MRPSAEGVRIGPARSVVPSYASTQLIAYLGNKRALLPHLLSLFRELELENRITRFLDPFAGSGSVARLARSLGWRVMASDAEEYSRAVNEAWLGVSSDELSSLFVASGGIEAVLERLNALHPERENREPSCACEPYIARHYAPERTEAADWRRERLFYTAENALFIDRVRSEIDAMLPQAAAERSARAERALLLGLVVYEAATHANTSGVFKAYHKGFGGYGRDALPRILSPMRLQPPPPPPRPPPARTALPRILSPMRLELPLLWPGAPAEVSRGDAAGFCAGRSAELCYLDPPYNQHQYGSNYHLLNTIARWDRAPVRDDRGPGGELLFVAGIPEAWKQSRSAFCSRATAVQAFRELALAIDARTIVLSYNTEGLASPEELVDLFSDRATVSIRALDYVKYRGGRQSASRVSRNSELLFIVRRHEGAAPRDARGSGGQVCAELANLKAELRLSRALAGPFDPKAFNALCASDGELRVGDRGRVVLSSYRGLVIDKGADEAQELLTIAEKERLAAMLEGAMLGDNASACRAAAELIESGASDRRLQELALTWLRKLAHRGYAESFRELSGRLRRAAQVQPAELGKLALELDKIDALFSTRLEGASRYPAQKARRR